MGITLYTLCLILNWKVQFIFLCKHVFACMNFWWWTTSATWSNSAYIIMQGYFSTNNNPLWDGCRFFLSCQIMQLNSFTNECLSPYKCKSFVSSKSNLYFRYKIPSSFNITMKDITNLFFLFSNYNGNIKLSLWSNKFQACLHDKNVNKINSPPSFKRKNNINSMGK